MEELITTPFQFPKKARIFISESAGLWNVIRKHPGVSLTLLICLVSYGGLYWLAFRYPAQTVEAFYDAINEKHVGDAWGMIHKSYKSRWNEVEKDFCDGFKTTQLHTGIMIRFDGARNPYCLAVALGSKSIQYEVSFYVTDRFTRAHCLEKIQRDPCLCLEKKDPTKYAALMSGDLITKEGGHPSLELVRRYKKTFTLQRVGPFKWEIGHIKTLEEVIIN